MGRRHSLRRYAVPEPLTPYVEWIWAVTWELPETVTQPAPVLSHPCVHATLEGDDGVRHGHRMPAALVHGVLTRRFDMELEGRGWVVGARFFPGGFSALTGQDAGALTDRVVRWDGERPEATAALSAARAATDEADRVHILGEWWGAQVPPEQDATYLVVRDLVAEVERDRSLVRVDDLAARHGLSVRGVQRLTNRYVGVPPTWLIRRYRMQDALAALQGDPDIDLAELATSLGWYDQAHFTRDFRTAVGQPPAAYLRELRSAPVDLAETPAGEGWQQAGTADATDLARIRHEAEQWLAARRIEQWNPGEVPFAELRAQLEHGEWQVARRAGRIAAALRYLARDPSVWPDDVPGQARYVHGLMVDRAVAEPGAGAAALRWAERHAVADGAAFLRLDCVESNTALRRYYADQGYVEVGRRDFEGPWFSATLFEKPL